MNEPSSQSRFHESAAAETVQYRALEPMAILCVLLSLLSIIAAFDIVGVFFAIFGVVLGLLSLARMKSRPEVFAGKKAALFGLGLSFLFLATGVTRHFTSEYMVRRQAKTVGQKFLDLVADNHPELAFQWTLAPKERCRSASNIWAFYKSNHEAGEKLREFVDKEGIRALLTLGKNTKIYPVGRSTYDVSGKIQSVGQTYAVDFETDGKKKTFFFGLLIRRFKSENGTPQWMIPDYVGGFDPWEKK